MKTNRIKLAAIAICVLALASCTKLNNNNTIADPNAKQHNEDVNNTKNESDNLNTDINNITRQVHSFSGKNSATEAWNICGATVDTTPGAYPTITIHFDGTTACGSPARIRSGVVTIELVAGAHWLDAGSQ